jgi:hypothetical protein
MNTLKFITYKFCQYAVGTLAVLMAPTTLLFAIFLEWSEYFKSKTTCNRD